MGRACPHRDRVGNCVMSSEPSAPGCLAVSSAAWSPKGTPTSRLLPRCRRVGGASASPLSARIAERRRMSSRASRTAGGGCMRACTGKGAVGRTCRRDGWRGPPRMPDAAPDGASRHGSDLLFRGLSGKPVGDRPIAGMARSGALRWATAALRFSGACRLAWQPSLARRQDVPPGRRGASTRSAPCSRPCPSPVCRADVPAPLAQARRARSARRGPT